MAEKFEDVVNKLGKATKKPSLSKAPIVVAVQLVDDKGKVIKEDSGAAVTEEKREALNREKKRTDLLKKISEALGGGKKAGAGKGKDEEKGGWTFGKGLLTSIIPIGMMAALPTVLATGLATLGIGAIIAGGVFAAVKAAEDGMAAWAEVEKGQWGTVDKVSGFIGGFLGGEKEGGNIWNALDQAWKGALAGMTIGLAFGLPGVIIGAVIGAAAGGILGWIGGQAIADFVDGTVLKFRNILDLPELLSPEQQAEVDKENKKLATQIDDLEEKILEYKRIIASDSSTLQERIDARVALRAAEKEVETKQDTIATNNRRVAENALAAQDNLIATNTKVLLEAQKEERIATRRFNNAKSRLFWAELIHGTESKQYNEAMDEYNETESALTDRKAHVVQIKDQRTDLKTKRSELRTEIDKEHKTFMGDTRLFFKGEMEWQKSLVSSIKDALNWIYTPGVSHPAGGKTTAKLFGVTLAMPDLGLQEKWDTLKSFLTNWFKTNIFDAGGGWTPGGTTSAKLFGFELKMPNLGLKEIWDNLKFSVTHWFRTNIFDWGGQAQLGTDKTTSLRIFGFDLDFPNMTEILKAHWDNFKEKIKDIVGWIYTPGRDAVPGAAGTGSIWDASPMILFGMEVPSLPNMKDALKTKWADFETFVEGIVGWIYTPGKKAEGKFAGEGMILFGMELKFPTLDISFEGMADKILDILPRWLTDPLGYIIDLVAEMMDFIPELPELPTMAGTVDAAEAAAAAAASWVTFGLFDSDPPGMRMGGPVTKGRPYLVGEGSTQGELFIPNSSGMILSAQRTAQILQAGLQRGAGAGGGATIVNAPVTSVNNSSSNMTHTTTSFSHPSLIIATVNAAA